MTMLERVRYYLQVYMKDNNSKEYYEYNIITML